MASFQQAMTMVFAIDEINRNPNLLPNITLGYHLYDNCVKLAVAFRAATALISGTDEVASSLVASNCTGSPPVIGIVGDPGSTHSIAISSVLGLFKVPMVKIQGKFSLFLTTEEKCSLSYICKSVASMILLYLYYLCGNRLISECHISHVLSFYVLLYFAFFFSHFPSGKLLCHLFLSH